jgi:hypothetical protein
VWNARRGDGDEWRRGPECEYVPPPGQINSGVKGWLPNLWWKGQRTGRISGAVVGEIDALNSAHDEGEGEKDFQHSGNM